ncbi:MAG: iron ABC transporter permease [Acidimicrobiia bacterium]|nr:iron ABC transporter permease [Acidimicrobiia bacterium]
MTSTATHPAREADAEGAAGAIEDVVVARRHVRPGVLVGGLAVALLVACVVAAGSGALAIPPSEILRSLLRRINLVAGAAPDEVVESVLWNVRFPRVVLALVVGAGLGCAGATMQGTFANPLAEPGVVGVSSGAALGAVAAIVIGIGAAAPLGLTVAAFVGGLVAVFLVFLAARSGGRTEVVTLIMTGIAVNAFTGAVIGLLTFFSTDAELRSITFWTLGSVAGATWAKVMAVVPLAVVGVAVAVRLAPRLDLLGLGDTGARHLGIDVDRLRFVLLAVVAVLTASAVAVSGIILFVGLVIPHLVRMAAGPRHRPLVVASALGGALILVVADLVARTIAAPAEVPLGVITALVGSPFFFWLLRRTRARQGGWA